MKKTCMFFVSDYHFEMISLPYINKNLKNNKNVIVISENNLKETMNKVLEMTNLNKEEKEKINNIDWDDDNTKKIEKINEAKEDDGKETVIFVKGNKEYINKINRKILNSENLNVIDCYDINEVHEYIGNIVKKYDNLLSTSGVEDLL